MADLDLLLTYAESSFPGLKETLSEELKVIHKPAIEISINADRPASDDFELIIVTSRNGAKYIGQFVSEFGHIPAASIGEHTAAELRESGFKVELISEGANSASLLNSLDKTSFTSALLVNSSASDSRISDQLIKSGWRVEVVVGYITKSNRTKELKDLSRCAKAIFVASPSAVDSVFESLEDHTRPGFISVGPRTSAHLRSLGTSPIAELDVTQDLCPQLLQCFIKWGRR